MLAISDMPIKTVTVATATYSLLVAANDKRVYLEVINDTASNIYVAYTNTAPTDYDSTTNGMKLLVAGENNIWSRDSVVPQCAVYVYQASGGNLKIKYSEGI